MNLASTAAATTTLYKKDKMAENINKNKQYQNRNKPKNVLYHFLRTGEQVKADHSPTEHHVTVGGVNGANGQSAHPDAQVC